MPRSQTLLRTALVLAVIISRSLEAQGSLIPAAGGEIQPAALEDYRKPAGRIEDGVLRIDMSVGAAAWRPWGKEGPAIRTHVYSVDAGHPRTPGPLIRVNVGTPVQITLRNSLHDRLVMRGLLDRGGIDAASPPFTPIASDSTVIAPGATAEIRFVPTEPGTFVYFGRTVPEGESSAAPTPLPVRSADRSLWGVLLVDPPDTEPIPGERIFLITHWAEPSLPGTFLPATRFFINGASWPHTERLHYAQGDTIRWRVINVTGRSHPMHLHGAYFSLDARGDQLRERIVPAKARRLAVTEVLDVTQTMRVSWVATEPGNWLFHCHFMRHMSWLQGSAPDAAPDRHAEHGAEGEALMGGLVLGIHVSPREGYTASVVPARRRFDLHITSRERVFGKGRGYGFVLATPGSPPPAADSVHFPGSTIVLTRGEPTEIVVRNRADVPLGVHWHGLELESWADGVPGWSGMSKSTTPAIAPGDSLTVRMTPPRAGTFMYHVHSEPGHQLAQGMYGPFLVVDGPAWDPDSDRYFLLGSLGDGDDPPPAVNGSLEPAPVELRAGTAYRLRFMHISPDDDKRVSLLSSDGKPVTWRFTAKDGADLPGTLVRDVPSQFRINVGETHDYVWSPQKGSYVLRVVTTFDQGVAAFRRSAPPPHTMDISVTAR